MNIVKISKSERVSHAGSCAVDPRPSDHPSAPFYILLHTPHCVTLCTSFHAPLCVPLRVLCTSLYNPLWTLPTQDEFQSKWICLMSQQSIKSQPQICCFLGPSLEIHAKCISISCHLWKIFRLISLLELCFITENSVACYLSRSQIHAPVCHTITAYWIIRVFTNYKSADTPQLTFRTSIMFN